MRYKVSPLLPLNGRQVHFHNHSSNAYTSIGVIEIIQVNGHGFVRIRVDVLPTTNEPALGHVTLFPVTETLANNLIKQHDDRAELVVDDRNWPPVD